MPEFIVVGDIHSDTSAIHNIPGLAKADGVIINGDLTTNGGRQEALAVLEDLASLNPRIFAQIGNMDLGEVERLLDEKGLNIHGRCLEIAPGVGLIGLGWATTTPFNTPSEASEEQMAEWLDRAYNACSASLKTLILISHTPPAGSTTAVIKSGVNVGSQAVREFIEKVQPALCLTGHIHEARGTDFIGPTKVINPGMSSEGGFIRLKIDDLKATAELEILT